MSELANNENEISNVEILTPSEKINNENNNNTLNVSDKNNNLSNITETESTTIENNTNIENENIDFSINNTKKNEIIENKEEDKQGNENDNNDSDEDLEIQYPSYSHTYSYNISNLSNNREDLGAGFRSRLKILGSPTKSSSSTTYTSSNVNPHISNTYQKPNTTTTTTTTTTSTSTTTTTKTTTTSNKSSVNSKIPNNNQSSSSSIHSAFNSIPKSESQPSTSIPKPIPTTKSDDDKNNTSSTSSAAAGKQKAEEDEEEEKRHMFECNICLDTASDPVVTMCGHFYCWPCIAMWLERSDQCPVCKSVISKEKIIPVYARGAERKDPREKDIPHRPAGHREEPSPQSRRQRRSPWNFESSFNFGLFPGFSFTFSNGGLNQGNPFHPGDSFFNPFGTMFNQPPPRRQPGAAGADPDEERHQENDVQNYILSAIIFFVIFSVFTSLMFNF